jgi:hypothetical protein
MRAPRTREQLRTSLAEDWPLWLLGGALFVVCLGTVYKFAKEPLFISMDSALFQHAGWYITQGAMPYTDIWDIKPPLIYGVTTLLALASGGNMVVLHLLSIATAVLVVSAGVALVGLLTHRLTGDGWASLVAAGAMFTIPTLYMYPYAGIRPKYFAFACVAGSLVLAVDERYGWAGALAAAAAGFWQLGLPTTGVVVAMAAVRGGRGSAARAVGGGLVVAVLTVAPFVLTGNGIPLYLEAVVVPMYGVDRYTMVGRLYEIVVELGYGLAVIPLGLYGLVAAVQRDRRYWWVLLGAGLYLLGFRFEMGGAIDAMLLYAFLAVGIGAFVASLDSPERRRLVGGVVAAAVVLSLAWSFGPVTPVKDAIEDSYEQDDIYDDIPERPGGVPETETIYWEKQRPATCNYHFSKKQIHFEYLTDGLQTRSDCGTWPFDRDPLEWTLDALWPLSVGR